MSCSPLFLLFSYFYYCYTVYYHVSSVFFFFNHFPPLPNFPFFSSQVQLVPFSHFFTCLWWLSLFLFGYLPYPFCPPFTIFPFFQCSQVSSFPISPFSYLSSSFFYVFILFIVFIIFHLFPIFSSFLIFSCFLICLRLFSLF